MTTNIPTSPPPGWYPAPDGSSETWWWDGARWAHPQPQHQPEQRPDATNAIAKLAMATQVLLLVCIVMSVATIGVETFGIITIADYLNGDDTAVDRFDTYDQSTFVVSILSSLVLITTAVIWVIWQYRVAKQVTGRTRRSPGWHAGSWFVPIISLWFPYQNVSDLWRAVGRTRPSWQIIWWLLWVVSNYVIQLSGRIYLVAEDLETMRVAMWMSLAGEVLLLAAAPLAWLVIRGITRGILQRPSNPVPAFAGGLTITPS
ncbi:hypothetical protein ASE14_08735 [Agromyces sp. Root81]|uniref:DUF4328 domain-containing protein n=1 Tax=Agromyces sp. Root81 TaxID=1736601 RepID=UPI0006FB00A3|nr:DUF4328 domain-containing protein [Agromyces sp. Root81]KRC61026.1 hypothetical protein ASE14_08735 [Agromyces sp. Root81]